MKVFHKLNFITQSFLDSLDISPTYLQTVLNVMSALQNQVYMVGEVVIASELGYPCKEIDLLTELPLTRVLQLLKYQGYKCKSINSGSVVVEVRGYKIKLTLTKSYIQFMLSKDFTCETLVMDSRGRVFEVIEGSHFSLTSRQIQFIKDDYKCLVKDTLIILKIMRFMSVYRFKLTPELLQSLHGVSQFTNTKVSLDVILSEIQAIFLGEYFIYVLTILNGCKVLDVLGEGLYESCSFNQNSPYHSNSLYIHSVQVLQQVKEDCASFGFSAKSDSTLLFIAFYSALFHDIGKLSTVKVKPDNTYGYPNHAFVGSRQVYDFLDRYPICKSTLEAITTLIQYHDYYISISPATRKSKILKKVTRFKDLGCLQIWIILMRSDILSHSHGDNDMVNLSLIIDIASEHLQQ